MQLTKPTVPWRFGFLRKGIQYRNWITIKHIWNKTKKNELLDSLMRGKNILFIHIPKTAGVSLISAYGECFADARHTPILFYRTLLPKQFGKFKTFSIIRNPWERLFSAYHFLIRGGLGGSDLAMGKVLLRSCSTFERFVLDWLPRHGVYCYGHFIPQYEFICDIKGRIIVEHLVKTEQLNTEWKKIAKELGLPEKKIPHLNKSGKRSYQDHYTPESIEIVRKLYKKDIRLFNYRYNQ